MFASSKMFRSAPSAVVLATVMATVMALATTAAAFAQPSGQDRPAGQFGETVEVSEVLLDVLVTDRDGNVVLGLDADDFVIEEKGRTIEPTGVTFYSNRFQLRDGEEGEIQHPLPNEVLADRHFILFFHDQRRGAVNKSRYMRQQLDAGRESRRWVAEEMLPGDWVAVVSFDYKLMVHTDFTRDRALLDRAIRDATRGKDPGNIWGEGRTEPAPEGHSLLAGLPEGKALRKETTRMYDALRLLADASQGIPGRKNVMLFTLGFGELEVIGNPANAVLASGVTSRPDYRFYRDLERSLNDGNVAVYPIYLDTDANDSAQEDFLSQLANDSGGRYYETFVNYIAPLKRIADENNGYYLLSYAAEHPAGESGYREVEVKTKNPEFRVRARKGYLYGDDDRYRPAEAGAASSQQASLR